MFQIKKKGNRWSTENYTRGVVIKTRTFWMQIETKRNSFKPVKLAHTKNEPTLIKSVWCGCWGKETLIHWWWKHRLVQLSWKTTKELSFFLYDPMLATKNRVMVWNNTIQVWIIYSDRENLSVPLSTSF